MSEQSYIAAKITWPDGSETERSLDESMAKAFGYRKAEPAAPPAWMVEVAREANALCCEAEHMPKAAAAYRRGSQDTDLVVSRSVASLRLALERGHVVEARPVPSEEEMLRDAREDAAQVAGKNGLEDWTRECRQGGADRSDDVQCALQARRNMLREWGAVAAPVVPAADWETALKRIWDAAFIYFAKHGLERRASEDAAARREAVSAILSTLPTREA